jgi:hypothetical protein
MDDARVKVSMIRPNKIGSANNAMTNNTLANANHAATLLSCPSWLRTLA